MHPPPTPLKSSVEGANEPVGVGRTKTSPRAPSSTPDYIKPLFGTKNNSHLYHISTRQIDWRPSISGNNAGKILAIPYHNELLNSLIAVLQAEGNWNGARVTVVNFTGRDPKSTWDVHRFGDGTSDIFFQYRQWQQWHSHNMCMDLTDGIVNNP
ncbi:11899_t:CDS:2, partial [Acaulospora colombiana]